MNERQSTVALSMIFVQLLPFGAVVGIVNLSNFITGRFFRDQEDVVLPLTLIRVWYH